MTEQHVPIEDLAAYAAGDLDATAAVAVEAHLLLCADCRADVDAVNAATAALAGTDRPAMPADVAARIDAALAAEDDDAHPVVTPMRGRRRPSWAGLAAVAAGVALVGAIAVPLVTRSGDPATTAADMASPERAVTTRRLSSDLDYSRATLAGTLLNALNGATGSPAPAAARAGAGAPAMPNTAPGGTAAPQNEAVTDVALTSTRSLEIDPGRLGACLAALSSELPANAKVPEVIDFARYEGQPAIIVAFPTVSRGRVRPGSLDVFVAGPRCGTGEDANVLDFQRIRRPGS